MSVVGTDGSVSAGQSARERTFIGGFSIVDVLSHEDALAWAAKFAVACRCAQEVRPLMDDPDV